MNSKKTIDIIKTKHCISPLQLLSRLNMLKNMGILKEKMYTVIGKMSECTGYTSKEPLPFDKKTTGNKIDLAVGKAFAKDTFDCAWLNIKGTIPDGYNQKDVVFLIDTAGEGLIYDTLGNVKQGITTFASQFSYDLGMPEKKVVFPDGLTNGNNIDFWVDAGANDLFGNLKVNGQIQQLDIAIPNNNIIALYYDLITLLGVYDNNKNSAYILNVFNSIKPLLKNIRNITDEKAKECRGKIANLLATNNDGEVFEYTAIGHAHLDLAWLWPIRESIRKGARTFSNQLLNIKLFDGYIFGASQAQLYQWVRDNYPDVYQNVKEAYQNGRWEIQGATWVEMDSNLTSGESLCRQFLYGKKYFIDEFGKEMKILWLPDSFGYSACLPQLMKLSDVDYFLTQKMSWNTVNKFPYHTFNWIGNDGTKVLAHMLPEDTYNGPATGDRAVFGEKNYKERAICNQAVSLFGIGDGGAGPGFDHIERATRMKDIKGLPKYNFGTAEEFFYKLDNDTDRFPSHKGELYLERHQGTYTTRVRNKKYNRQCEFLLQNYEKLITLANFSNTPINKAELEVIWKEILLYQFHDILPGSSINRVYDETDARYKDIFQKLTTAVQTVAKQLFDTVTIVNFNSFDYQTKMQIGDKWYDVCVPKCGYQKISSNELLNTFVATLGADFVENDKISIHFQNGNITSIFDKIAKKELVKNGLKTNIFTQYTDLGDCWDIRPTNYQKLGTDAKCTSFKTGTNGAMAFADLEYCVGETVIKQRVFVTDGSPLITFDTSVDNKCSSKDLRVALPFDIQTEEATFNVQYGHIKRRTTENNSIEKAQFEVSGQKFVDLSTSDYGISVINDCKYGFRVKNNTIDICLVRTPAKGPGKNVDQGVSTFKYAILPHNTSDLASTYKEAYLLNNPLMVVDGSLCNIAESLSLCTSSSNDVIIETVKQAEDGNGVIVRAYNISDSQKTASITLNGYKATEIVNIMERNLNETDAKDLSFHEFELKNIRFVK